jgi:hypothetical protein
MSKHNELRDRINELCPELKKLEFGCKMIKKDELKDWAKLVTLISYDGKRSRGYFREQDGSIFSLITDFKKFEILGKDPTLEDVMRAIEKQYKDIGGGVDFNIGESSSGDSIIETTNYVSPGELDEDNESFTFHWQLGKPLSQQSDETVEKILEILK